MIRIPKKRIADTLIWLLAVTLLLWLGDWAVWRIRVWRGGGYDSMALANLLHIDPDTMSEFLVRMEEPHTAALAANGWQLCFSWEQPSRGFGSWCLSVRAIGAKRALRRFLMHYPQAKRIAVQVRQLMEG